MKRPFSDRETYRLLRLYAPPADVEAASSRDLAGDDLLADAMFADPAGRRYALHTKQAAWVSLAASIDGAAEIGPRERERIDRAVAYFGLESCRDDIMRKKAEYLRAETAPLPDAAYAWLDRDPDGETVRRLPMPDPAAAIKTAAYLVGDRDRFDYDDRRRMAVRVLGRASDLGSDLGELSDPLEKMAAVGVPVMSVLVPQVRARAAAIREKSLRFAKAAEELSAMADQYLANPEYHRDRDAAIKTAALLDEVDSYFGLRRDGRNPELLPPEEAVFAVTHATLKQAEAAFVRVAGRTYLRGDVDSVRVDALADMVGEALAGRLSMDGVKLASERLEGGGLTADQVDVLEAALKAAGVAPVEKASDSFRLDRDALLALAREVEG